MMQQTPILCLMGPTAAGKTPLAVEIVQHFPCEIISVDSAQVYRSMDIGTAKPTIKVLKTAPHRLIDILDPKTPYSAGQFRIDALTHIKDIAARGKIPLLVGGTMLYFRVLQQGLAHLPPANEKIRTELTTQMEQLGIEGLYARLLEVDPVSAQRIHTNDSQRIKRALEVYLLTGKRISDSQSTETHPLVDYTFHNIMLIPNNRANLHERIAQRFQQMLTAGLLEEVKALYQRGDLVCDLPSIRSVGYRQVWEYLSGQLTYSEMCERAIAATRQLAKRQITWLRSWPAGVYFDCDHKAIFPQVRRYLDPVFSALPKGKCSG